MTKKIVYTDKYALILSDEELNKGDLFLDTNSKTIHTCELAEGLFNTRKKIAGHLPLSDAPILEGVPLLPPLPQGEDVEELATNWFVTANKKDTIFNKGWVNVFKGGYNKAKEKYKYTEEDLKLAMNYGYVQGDTGFQGIANLDDLLDLILKKVNQQQRPTHFKCETTTMNEGYTDESDFPYQEIELPKTITNSQGLQELVGKYFTK